MELPPNFENHVAGPIGAAIALIFTKEGWRRSVALLIGGSAVAYYASAFVSNLLGMPEGLTGLLLGFVSMALAAKLLETIGRIDFVQWALDFRKKWFGV